MSRYENRQDFADKASWEGGLEEFVFGYGVSVDDLPEDDIELREALAEVLKAGPALERLHNLLPDAEC